MLLPGQANKQTIKQTNRQTDKQTDTPRLYIVELLSNFFANTKKPQYPNPTPN